VTTPSRTVTYLAPNETQSPRRLRKHIDVSDRLTAIGQHYGDIDEHPSTVVARGEHATTHATTQCHRQRAGQAGQRAADPARRICGLGELGYPTRYRDTGRGDPRMPPQKPADQFCFEQRCGDAGSSPSLSTRIGAMLG